MCKAKVYKGTIMLKTLMSLCMRLARPGKWRMRMLQLLGIEIRPARGNEQFCALDDC